MKKILSIVFISAFVFVNANAQEGKGKFAVDFNFDPAAIFDASAGPMFQMPNLKGRYFISSSLAIRAGIGLGFGSDKVYTDIDPAIDDYMKTTDFYLSVSPGIEKHFGSDKFLVYAGGEIPFSTFSTKRETKVGATTTDSENINGGYTGIGFNFVAGFDFYVFDNFYIGAEFAPGFDYRKNKEVTVGGTVTQKESTGFDFGLTATSGIRIGVRF
ncbi:MAG: hypothetical protein PF485_03805 [Bacteroidales bacterium]|jgi:hypothetical protein|nr:hypothetical protein [Bacteroidales bacterium]